MSALSDLINRELKRQGRDGWSLRALADQSDGTLSRDNIRKYRHGLHGTPEESTLAAWAEFLGIDIAELRAAAGVPTGEAGPYVPPPESARLSRRQRDALNELIRSFLDSEAGDLRGDAAPIGKAPTPPPEGADPAEVAAELVEQIAPRRGRSSQPSERSVTKRSRNAP